MSQFCTTFTIFLVLASIIIPKSVNLCCIFFLFFLKKYMLYINDAIIGAGGEVSQKVT